MKKLAVLAVMGLLVSTTAFAEVAVLQDGRTVTYEQGTPVMTSGATPVRVLYDGVEIYVPQGQKVLISKAKDGKVLVTGTDLKGVEVGKERFSSKGLAVFSISPATMKVDEIKGDISVANIAEEDLKAQKEAKKAQKAQKAQKAAKATKAEKTTKVATTKAVAPAQTVEFPTASEYVNEVITQQSAQNTEECMSQSSPSGAC